MQRHSTDLVWRNLANVRSLYLSRSPLIPLLTASPQTSTMSRTWVSQQVCLFPLEFHSSRLPPTVWISPVNQNWLGPTTVYGDPYHGYWIQDVSQLNDRFGTAADLKALSAELHRRGMHVVYPPHTRCFSSFSIFIQVPHGRRSRKRCHVQ
jgi:Alpha amylase, catalytic domain